MRARQIKKVCHKGSVLGSDSRLLCCLKVTATRANLSHCLLQPIVVNLSNSTRVVLCMDINNCILFWEFGSSLFLGGRDTGIIF